jgi:nucleoside-diphosphate-sugar epimerase
MNRLLITGINGLIGSILHPALQGDYEVYGLDQKGPFSERILCVDIAEYEQLSEAIQGFHPLDAIIHLAGDPRVTASWESVLHANIIGTRNVFEVARAFGVPKVIFASSSHTTGVYQGFDLESHSFTEPDLPMISPADPVRPDSEYGVSKVFGEVIGRYYSDRWGIQVICLRIGAVLKQDDPATYPQNRRIWLSHRDLQQLVKKSLTANVRFGVYYGVSNNQGAFWDISNARTELGYEPVDDGARQ